MALPLTPTSRGLVLVADEVGKKLYVVGVPTKSRKPLDAPKARGAALNIDAPSGPTHLALHPSGSTVFALCQRSSTLLVCTLSGGMDPPILESTITLSQRGRVTSGAASTGTGGNADACVLCTTDGRFVYTSVGGRIHVLRVSDGDAHKSVSVVFELDNRDAQVGSIALSGAA